MEQHIQDLGSRLLGEVRAKHGTWAHRHEDALLVKLMSDDHLRVQVLRFVDVLPSLTEDGDLVHHLEEYLGDQSMPSPVASGRSLRRGIFLWRSLPV